jgi:predicted anti-sigma-YlaC factor YlaD
MMVLSGCSVRQTMLNAVSESISRTGDSYATDDDLALIESASPFGLKLIEGMLAETPRHEGLLLSAARGFTQYAFTFVETPAQEMEERDVAAALSAHQRARNLFLRAKEYGLRGLEVSFPDFRTNLARDLDRLLAKTGAKDVPLLYWTAVSWGAAISLGKERPEMLAEIPLMQKMASRALELDESFDFGAIHTFFITLAMSRPLPENERITEARHHFNRAVELSAGRQASPFITYAESVSIPTRNRDEFREMLEKGLSVDVSSAPSFRLANEFFQKRARWLSSHADLFFAE